MTINTERRGNRVGAVPRPQTIPEVIDMLRLALSKPSRPFPYFRVGYETGFRAGIKRSIEVLEALEDQSK